MLGEGAIVEDCDAVEVPQAVGHAREMHHRRDLQRCAGDERAPRVRPGSSLRASLCAGLREATAQV